MYRFIIVIALIICSCNKDANLKPYNKKNINVSDTEYVKIDSFPVGDSRRYGVFPNKSINANYLKNIFSLASKGLPITFTSGYYKANFNLKNIKNATFNFQDAIVNGSLSIVDSCKYISFTGKLTVLDKLFIRNASYIHFESVDVSTDTVHNVYRKKNRGVSIYSGSKNITFNTLNIDKTGGLNNTFYKYTAAALQIHGYNNNPEHIEIKDLKITNSDRTALFITGNNHKFNKVAITNFALGSSQNMFGLEDAISGTEKEFTGAWLAKCNNVTIDSLEINQNYKKGINSIRLDEGKYHEPTFINHIKITGYAKQLKIEDHKLTNILVKDEYE